MTDKVTKLALASRIIVLAVQLVANAVVPDHKPDVFRGPIASDASPTPWLDKIVNFCFGGLRHWDGEYFLHIAENLYSYENTLAFYPLFPLLVRHIGQALIFLHLPISVRSANLLVAVFLNMFTFCKAAQLLYQLTQRIFNDLNKSWNVVLLFCFNPAAIFFSAAYSEAIFACGCFYLMLDCVSDLTFNGTTMALLSTFLCRSNGLLNAGFPVYFYVRAMMLSSVKFKYVLKLFAMLILSLLPLTIFYFYIFQQFCIPGHVVEHKDAVINYAHERGYVLAGHAQENHQSPWCNETLPFPYSYIQKYYWRVGFLQYYEWRQLPNFLIAMPILLFLHYHCYSYLRHFFVNLLPKYKLLELLKQYKSLPFVLHAFFLTMFCTFFVHIQVSTRILASATPCLYWFAADHMPKTLAQVKFPSKAAWILLWFAGYYLLGIVLFSNNLPWT